MFEQIFKKMPNYDNPLQKLSEKKWNGSSVKSKLNKL